MMAMMMTGRVLLVCALCVLWCGVAAVKGDDDAEMESEEESKSLSSGFPDGGKGKQHESEGSARQESETANVLLAAGGGKKSIPQDKIIIAPANIPDGTDGEKEKEKIRIEEAKGVIGGTENIGTPQKDEKTLQLKASPLAEEKSPAERQKAPEETPPGTPPASPEVTSAAENLTATPGEEIVTSADSSNQSQGGKKTADGLAAKMPSREKGKAPEAPPSPPAENEIREGGNSKVRTNNENTSTEDVASVKETESLLEDKEVKINLRKEGPASITGNQEGGLSDGLAESTPPSISATINTANDVADNDTHEGMPNNNNSAADGAVTEGGQQDENKEENTNVTKPLKSAALINETLPPGDSDSSTAASHTTSPLLLFFLLACAAAAAVVAA
ncbi:mucin-associated surface protein (MASP), putative [Trypanosoma cruzi marinkellei]|uniref:Mucin-associated surface protein (MASP), putative n=1 Tax=Trypanosoma cruzi marinkellei TaxID=85056 RepID=K2N412_TRYCR|nr:mucin-associated surface protein (MASP), putative [Trypanosoma cruzi marinkellei]